MLGIIEKRLEKKDLANWMSLALNKALTTSNINVGFKKSGIRQLKFQVLQLKMGPSKGFLLRTPVDVGLVPLHSGVAFKAIAIVFMQVVIL